MFFLKTSKGHKVPERLRARYEKAIAEEDLIGQVLILCLLMTPKQRERLVENYYREKETGEKQYVHAKGT